MHPCRRLGKAIWCSASAQGAPLRGPRRRGASPPHSPHRGHFGLTFDRRRSCGIFSPVAALRRSRVHGPQRLDARACFPCGHGEKAAGAGRYAVPGILGFGLSCLQTPVQICALRCTEFLLDGTLHQCLPVGPSVDTVKPHSCTQPCRHACSGAQTQTHPARTSVLPAALSWPTGQRGSSEIYLPTLQLWVVLCFRTKPLLLHSMLLSHSSF